MGVKSAEKDGYGNTRIKRIVGGEYQSISHPDRMPFPTFSTATNDEITHDVFATANMNADNLITDLLAKLVRDGVADDLLAGRKSTLGLPNCNVFGITEAEYWSFIQAILMIGIKKYHIAFNFDNVKKKRAKGQKKNCVNVLVKYNWTHDISVQYFKRSATGEILMGSEIATATTPTKEEENPI